MEWSICDLKRVIGDKNDYWERWFKDDGKYILRFMYKLEVNFKLELGEVVNCLFSFKKFRVMENDDILSENIKYKIKINKNVLFLDKNNIKNKINWELLLGKNDGDINFMKKYLLEISKNTFFGEDIKEIIGFQLETDN